MDDRSLSWMHLLPADASICPWNAPIELLGLLTGKLDRAGNTWLGWEPTMSDMPTDSDYRAIVLIKPRGISSAWLRDHGYKHVRWFAVVPHMYDARWFISLQSKHVSTRAWDLYTPFREQARLRKAAAKLLARSGVMGYVGDQVVVAQKERSPIEETLMHAVNTSQFSISIASGTTGPRRKLTMQLTRPDGSVLAYAKCADRPETGDLIKQEVQLLEYLRQCGLEMGIVPTLFYHGPFNDGYLMVSAPLDDQRAPSDILLTQRHFDVLRELARRKGPHQMLDIILQLQQRVDAMRDYLSDTWYQRLSKALQAVMAVPDVQTLPTTLAHGDFTPWNLRVNQHTGQLAIFDWEHGRRSQMLLWDAFHFKTQVDLLVRRRDAETSVATTIAEVMHSPLVQDWQLSRAQIQALYVGYVVDASLQWFEDRQMMPHVVPHEDMAQDRRGQMIDIGTEALAHYTAVEEYKSA